MPVSMALIDAVGLQPGHAVLELAAGLGDTGFLAAELIRPGGELVSSDFAPEMLTAAQGRAGELGLDNVRFRLIDAESIDLDAASLDAVLCRWGYMLMADPVAALRETRRVLKPGGRVALAAWTSPEENLWSALPGRVLVRRGLAEPPDPGPGQFAWARRELIVEALADAGFVEDIAIEPLGFTVHHASVEDWWATMEDLSERLPQMMAGLEGPTRADVKVAVNEEAAPFTGADGRLAIPARTWIASATA